MPLKADKLYVVVPCYNEEAVLPETTRRLGEKLHAMMAAGSISADSRVLFVDDGSRDRTWELIEQAHAQDELFTGAKLSRNRGHQNALLAGLMTAKDCADMVISMDADLQDDINAMDKFVEEYYAGHDIVYGVRSSRATDTAFKRLTGEDAPVVNVPKWLDRNKNTLQGTVVAMPTRDDIDFPVEEHLIVELYSK